jgi:hypothetical protein
MGACAIACMLMVPMINASSYNQKLAEKAAAGGA